MSVPFGFGVYDKKGTPATGVVSAAGQIVAANGKRMMLFICNAGSSTIYIKPGSDVTTANGYPLAQNDFFVDFVTTNAWYVAGTSINVRYIEVTA